MVGTTQPRQSEPECPATREAVVEAEGWGEFNCPICGQAAIFHRSEDAHEWLDGQEKVAVPHGGQIIAEGHNHDCCPPDDCCGGPCAAHPSWELTT